MINAIKKPQKTSLTKCTPQKIRDKPTRQAMIKEIMPSGNEIFKSAKAIVKALTVWRLGNDSSVLWSTKGSILNTTQGRGRL